MTQSMNNILGIFDGMCYLKLDGNENHRPEPDALVIPELGWCSHQVGTYAWRRCPELRFAATHHRQLSTSLH